jgi:hypothetical protein
MRRLQQIFEIIIKIQKLKLVYGKYLASRFLDLSIKEYEVKLQRFERIESWIK